MHCLEVIKHLNNEAAIKGVSRRAKAGRKYIPFEDYLADAHDEELADKALAGDRTAWDATVERLAQRGM